MSLVIAAFALFLLVACGDDWGPLGYPLLMGGVAGATCLPTVAVHEFGHALFGAAVGRKVFAIHIGVGTQVGSARIGDTKIFLGRDISRGFVMSEPSDDRSKWKASIYLGGGILANLIFSAGSLLVAGAIGNSVGGVWGSCWLFAGLGVAFTNLFTAGAAVSRRTMTINGVEHWSDGHKIWRLWRAKSDAKVDNVTRTLLRAHFLLAAKRWADAEQLCCAGFEKHPEQPWLLGAAMHAISNAQSPQAALQYYLDQSQRLPGRSESDADQMPYIWGNAAWFALLAGDEHMIDLADDLSRRALEAAPKLAPIVATRGALLVRRGDRDEGLSMLMHGLRETPEYESKAEFCAFLAGDAKRVGDLSLAQSYDRLAKHFAAAA